MFRILNNIKKPDIFDLIKMTQSKKVKMTIFN